jgi:hypothetical protein
MVYQMVLIGPHRKTKTEKVPAKPRDNLRGNGGCVRSVILGDNAADVKTGKFMTPTKTPIDPKSAAN